MLSPKKELIQKIDDIETKRKETEHKVIKKNVLDEGKKPEMAGYLTNYSL